MRVRVFLTLRHTQPGGDVCAMTLFTVLLASPAWCLTEYSTGNLGLATGLLAISKARVEVITLESCVKRREKEKKGTREKGRERSQEFRVRDWREGLLSIWSGHYASNSAPVRSRCM